MLDHKSLMAPVPRSYNSSERINSRPANRHSALTMTHEEDAFLIKPIKLTEFIARLQQLAIAQLESVKVFEKHGCLGSRITVRLSTWNGKAIWLYDDESKVLDEPAPLTGVIIEPSASVKVYEHWVLTGL